MFAGRRVSGRPAAPNAPPKTTSTILIGIYAALCFLFALFLTWQIFAVQTTPQASDSSFAQVFISRSARLQPQPIDRTFLNQQEKLVRSRAVIDRVIDAPVLAQKLRGKLGYNATSNQPITAQTRLDLRTYVLDRLKIATTTEPAQLTFNLRMSDPLLANQLSNAIAQSYAEVLALGGAAKVEQLHPAQGTVEQVDMTWIVITLAFALALGVILLLTFLFRLQAGPRAVARYKSKGGFQPPRRGLGAAPPRYEQMREPLPPRTARQSRSLPKIFSAQTNGQPFDKAAHPQKQTRHAPTVKSSPEQSTPQAPRTRAPSLDKAIPVHSQIGQPRPVGARITDLITANQDQPLVLFVGPTSDPASENGQQESLVNHLLETAWEMKQRGKNALIIDAAWAPDLSDTEGHGLSDLIAGRADFGEILHCDEATGLSYVPRGAGAMKAHALPELIDLRDAMLALFDAVLVNIGDGQAKSLLSTFAEPNAQIMIIGPAQNLENWPADEQQMERDNWQEAGFNTVHLINSASTQTAQSSLENRKNG